MEQMNNKEKAELLKNTIAFLYSNEGKSKSYISRLLEIERTALTKKIDEWGLPQAPPHKHVKPSTKKFINKHRTFIKSRLDRDITITKIAEELGVTRYFLQETIIPNDPVLNKAKEDYVNRIHDNSEKRKEEMMEKSSFNYFIQEVDGEEWKTIPGYHKYMVSNMGRIKKYSSRYGAYFLITSSPNKNNGRLYVRLYSDDGNKNLQIARLVAHAFVSGHDEVHNTVNHKDGNVQNNTFTNLEWSIQADNNLHAYRDLKRGPGGKRRCHFTTIIYKNKFEFKTIAAFARFLNKSETQTRRYLDEPEKHEIQLIK